MTLGQLIKSYRLQMNLSQPELSEKSNIEQSYLSKLENDKSVPSDDIFKGILQALNLQVWEFVSQDAYASNPGHFDQIPLIKSHFEQQKQKQILSQRNFLYLCTFLVAFGIAAFYSGYKTTIFSENVYIYKSLGEVKADEPLNIFSTSVHKLVDRTDPDYDTKSKKMEFQMTQRRITEYRELKHYQGNSFVESTYGGRRLFNYYHLETIPRTINGVLQFIGLLLVVLGLVGFVVERRIYR